MGAPKQKWTAEEEAALKAGVVKHGTGKWRTILLDPEFSSVLRLRSNVDLKDKWRNINVTAIWGSRQKAKLALKRSPHTPKRGDHSKTLINVPQGDGVVDAKPLAVSSGTPRNGVPKDLLKRLDNIILEAITTLKERRGSDRASIVLYIEDKYVTPANLKKLVALKLKHLTANGKLIKVKHRYMIASNSKVSEGRRTSPLLLLEGNENESLKSEVNTKILTQLQVELELSKMRGVSALEAAAAAAKAVAEAEAATAEAEAAAREAELAEAEAEAAQVFAKAAMKAFKYRLRHVW